VVPVKPLAHAKSRLRGGWITEELRPRLALAFAADAVEAALRAEAVAEAVVVTDDPEAAVVLGELGATVVPDEPDAGLNPALAFGARIAAEKFGGVGIAALAADLPALRPLELNTALSAISDDGRFFIPDAHDIGTTMLFATPGLELDPRFGGPSRIAHLQSGAVALTRFDITTLRRDVDTPEDLADAVRLGVGPRTRALLQR
jgi:2-phospho-L-lactate guanylyltransferase